ncbi:class I SAM-dependent methyltransferase [Phenylobacterium sp. 20VBR1]|uniref:Class I SAM-dependent methyltransferase n=1 Tax=Phenylobacterium glaciei TaxID=2803784 RepID=A0A941D6B0_9CAUL|nr:class I SAM-dependent methyltransferase [Phenylobacterium glaciei]MBR7621761.1 class I SAM-dependent methyltransferase [Phenylobacterium glaciei]
MAVQALLRDTDADWQELGATQPYWGVLTHPSYRTENLTDDALAQFFGSGVDHVDRLVAQFQRLYGVAPQGRALDFGCGAGRLTEAMAAYAGETIGYDISPGMLNEARKRGVATYVGELPAGPFGWINSFIVLQHIPPERGMALIEDLLERLSPGGLLSLQLTVWRDARHDEPGPAPRTGWRAFVPPALRRSKAPPPPPKGLVMMFDYDLSAVVRLLNEHGVEEMNLVSTHHDGHNGVLILARREGQSPQEFTRRVRSPAAKEAL